MHRSLLVITMALVSMFATGCYVTDWRWIWEDDDDHQCHYAPPVAAPAPAPVQSAPPPGYR